MTPSSSSTERACCMCGTHKFVGRVNAGKKYYCNACMKKINDSGMNYWKPCSQVEFFENMLSDMRKGSNRKSKNMFSNINETLRKIDKEKNEFNSGTNPDTNHRKEKVFDWIKCDDCDFDKRILCPKHNTIFEDLDDD